MSKKKLRADKTTKLKCGGKHIRQVAGTLI
jgi:hypothetical protein